MTQVIFDVVDLVGEAHPGDTVSVWPPYVTSTADGRVKSTRKIDVLVDEGPVTEDIEPGPLMVQLQCRGIADTKPRTVTIPDEGTITLANLLQSTFTYTPAVVSQVARDAAEAREAADRVGTAEQVGEWAAEAAAAADRVGTAEQVETWAEQAEVAADDATSAATTATSAASTATSAATTATSAASTATGAATTAEGIAENLPSILESELGTRVPAELDTRLPTELDTRLPTELDTRVPPIVTNTLAADQTMRDAAATAAAAAVADAVTSSDLTSGNLASGGVTSGAWLRYNCDFVAEGNPATLKTVGTASQVYTSGTGTGGLPVRPEEVLTVAYDVLDSVSTVYTTFVYYDAAGAEVQYPNGGQKPSAVTPNAWTRVYQAMRVPAEALFAQVRIAYATTRTAGATFQLRNITITSTPGASTGEYAEAFSAADIYHVHPALSMQSPPVPSPAALRPWFNAVSQRFTRPINIYALGDSITEGAGASDPSRRWINLAQQNLRDVFGLPEGPDNPFIPTRYGSGISAPWAPTRTGNVTDLVARGPGWRASLLNDSTAAIEYVFRGDGAAFALTTSGDTTVEVTVNGAPTQHVINIAETDGLWTVPGVGYSTTDHVVKLRLVSGAPLRVDGLYIWKGDKARGIRIIDAAYSGYGYGSLGYADVPYIGHDIARVKPDLIISGLMSNDITGNNLSRTTSIMGDYVKAYQSAAPGVPIILVSMYKRADHDEATHKAFQRMVADKVATTPGVFFLDFRRFMPDFVAPTTDSRNLSMSADGDHPTDLGHKRLAEVVSTVLSNPGQVTM